MASGDAQRLRLAAFEGREPCGEALAELVDADISEALFRFLAPTWRRPRRRVCFDVTEERFPCRFACTGHGAKIAAHEIAPTARGIERVALVMPQHHVDLLHRRLIARLARIPSLTTPAFELGLEAA